MGVSVAHCLLCNYTSSVAWTWCGTEGDATSEALLSTEQPNCSKFLFEVDASLPRL